MNKFIILMLLSMPVFAIDVQWSKGYLGNCDNPTERVDGTPLLASEIDHVVYQIKSGDQVVYEALMAGGCKETFIDTKLYVPPGDYLLYGYTVDTEGRESVLSEPGVVLTVQKARPKAPSGFR